MIRLSLLVCQAHQVAVDASRCSISAIEVILSTVADDRYCSNDRLGGAFIVVINDIDRNHVFILEARQIKRTTDGPVAQYCQTNKKATGCEHTRGF